MTDTDDFTELVDADFNRVDLVKRGANGFPRFLVAKGDSGGLFDAGYVRELITKATPQTGGRKAGIVKLSGSPAAIAELIHESNALHVPEVVEAARVQAQYEAVVKAKYSAKDRRRMAASGAAMEDGSYPIEDREDLTRAIRAVGRGDSSHNAIRRHIITRARSLGASKEIPDTWNSDGSMKKVIKAEDPDILAEPDKDAPGDPATPGSPAWESVDSATAQQWTGLLSRARVAVGLLADREMLEAASADPADQGNALDLDTVCQAIDYAIGVLAPYAVAEASEADAGMLPAVGKALGDANLAGPLAVIEGIGPVAKTGRVLSSVNETRIRQAADALSQVLATLPQPVAAREVIKEQQEATMTSTGTDTDADAGDVAKTASPEEQAADRGPVKVGGTTGMGQPRETGPAAALPADGPQAKLPGDYPGRTVIKDSSSGDGDKPKMQAVFDADGHLVGVVNPDAITPVAGTDAAAAAPEQAAAQPAADAASLTPQPAGDAGTPAGAAKAGPAAAPEDVAKQEQPATPPGQAGMVTIPEDVLKSTVAAAVTEALAAQAASHAQEVAKTAAGTEELAREVAALKGRLETVEAHPAAPKVFTNGQVPPAQQMRGQDRAGGGMPVDLAKAAERRRQLYQAPDATEQNRIAKEMNGDAIEAIKAIHAR